MPGGRPRARDLVVDGHCEPAAGTPFGGVDRPTRRRHRKSRPLVSFAGSHLAAELPNTHVRVDGRPVLISPREAEVLGVLLAQCNRLVRRELLMLEIWGYPTRTLDVYVRRLRVKLGAAGRQLETVRQFGYRFIEPALAAARADDRRVHSGESEAS